MTRLVSFELRKSSYKILTLAPGPEQSGDGWLQDLRPMVWDYIGNKPCYCDLGTMMNQDIPKIRTLEIDDNVNIAEKVVVEQDGLSGVGIRTVDSEGHSSAIDQKGGKIHFGITDS